MHLVIAEERLLKKSRAVLQVFFISDQILGAYDNLILSFHFSSILTQDEFYETKHSL